MTSPPEDRRREPRHSIRLDVDIATDGNFVFARATDISSMGMFLRAEPVYPVGTPLTLRFRPKRGADPIEVQGVVRWASNGAGQGRAGMGIQFDRVPPAIRTRIFELVKSVAYLGS